MSKYKWLEKMKPASKLLFHLGIIKYAHLRQSYSGGKYYGRFTYVFYNPLTWLFLLFLFAFILIADICDTFFRSVIDVIEFVRDGVEIELDRE